MHLCVGSSTEVECAGFVQNFATPQHGYLWLVSVRTGITVAALHPLVATINILSKIFLKLTEDNQRRNQYCALHLHWCPAVITWGIEMGWKNHWAWYWTRISPNDCRVNNNDVTYRGSWKTRLACGWMEKLEFMLIRLCGWRMAKWFVTVWGCSCQHLPVLGWILGSSFCRPISFLWKHTLSEIWFRFPENPKI